MHLRNRLKISMLIIKVRDHCHCTGKHRIPAHRICNLRYSILNEILVIFVRLMTSALSNHVMISLKESINLNVNIDMTINLVNNGELNTKILSAIFNTQMLKMVY